MNVQGVEIHDYRAQMKRAKWSIGVRTKTLYLTVHYNGPPVNGVGNPESEITQLIGDSKWHMRPGALGAGNGGDGIQYHGATLSDGTHIQLRDLNAQLWHCHNVEGNKFSLSWHVPIGGKQEMTAIQQNALFADLIPSMMKEYGFDRFAVRGHMEWHPTSCPGTIMPLIKAWRTHSQYFVTQSEVNVREKPDSRTPAKLLRVLPQGVTFKAVAITEGAAYNYNKYYVLHPNGGYIHTSVLKGVE